MTGIKYCVQEFCVRELQQSGVAVGGLLNMKRSGVCLAVRRGEKIVMQDQIIMKVVFGG